LKNKTFEKTFLIYLSIILDRNSFVESVKSVEVVSLEMSRRKSESVVRQVLVVPSVRVRDQQAGRHVTVRINLKIMLS
jgi:uncharacterized protein YycO